MHFRSVAQGPHGGLPGAPPPLPPEAETVLKLCPHLVTGEEDRGKQWIKTSWEAEPDRTYGPSARDREEFLKLECSGVVHGDLFLYLSKHWPGSLLLLLSDWLLAENEKHDCSTSP